VVDAAVARHRWSGALGAQQHGSVVPEHGVGTGAPIAAVVRGLVLVDTVDREHFNVTEHPTAAWTARQIVEAFPWEEAPRYLLRDRDGVYGDEFVRRIEGMGIHQVLIARRSPWQTPYVERVIGSIRRECLAHVVVLSERHLRRVLADYLAHYHSWRCHRSLEMDCPLPRPVQPPEVGEVVEVVEPGGLHRHYERRAA